MADYSMPGMVFDPATATPEQLKYMRELAMQLATPPRAEDIAPHWTGALAAGLRGITGPLYANRANELQAEALRRYGRQYGTAVDQMNPRIVQPPTAAPPVAPQQQNAPAPSAPQVSAQPTAYAGAPQGNAQDAITGAMREPRGIRNNNPGNIKDSEFAKSQPGYAGTDGVFAIFNSPAAGEAAMDKLLQSYADRGLNTPAGIINRWAPPSENNSSSYAATVAKGLGVNPNTPLDMNNPTVRQALAANMATVETGRPYQMRGPQGPQIAQAGAVDPRLLGAIEANPWASDATKGAFRQYAVPQPAQDVEGRAGVYSPQGGVRTVPAAPGFAQGFRGPFNVTTPAASVAGTAVYPAGQSGGGIGPAANAGMDVAEKMAGRGAVIAETAKQTGADIANANASMPQIQILRTMRDTIKNSPTLQFGPTAPWFTTLQMAIANHAPDLLSPQQLQGIAAANGIDKLSAQLANVLSSNGSTTDAKLFNNLHAIPGRAVNSKEGMIDLIDMIIQQQGINHQFISQNMGKISQGMSSADFITLRNKYFEDHPIINPATHNPIVLDLRKSAEGLPTGGAASSQRGDLKKLSDDELKKRLRLP